MSPVRTPPMDHAAAMSRRSLLLAGALGTAGLSVQAALSPRAAVASDPGHGAFGKAKHVVHIYLHGGAPTQDMWDMKPAAPAEIRGEFRPIATSAAGIQICEHLPKTAKWMHRAAIVRSVHHKAGCHNCLPSFTGSEQPVDVNEPVPRDTYPPGMGAVCEYLKPADVE